MNDVTTINTSQKMTSREIAEYTGKEHYNVLRDIQKLIDEQAITALNLEVSEYKDGSGKMNPMYILDFDATLTLITGYDSKKRAAVIKRWRLLETGEAMPSLGVYNRLAGLMADMSTRLEHIENRSEKAITYNLTSSVADFVKAACWVDGDRFAEKKRLYDAYCKYCLESNVLVEKYDIFFRLLYRLGLPVRKATMRFEDYGKRFNIVKGIGLVSHEAN